ncbi:pentatricopeptide repeat-containing protein At5g50990-like [Wolffia australiana]
METLARMTKTGGGEQFKRSLFRVLLESRRLDEARRLLDEMPTSDPRPWNLLLAATLRAGRLAQARTLFEEMPSRDLVSWNTMAAGCARGPRPEEAVALFEAMRLEPDARTFAAVLSGCARAGALAAGRRVHALVRAARAGPNPILAAALIDMYCKCGRPDLGAVAFESASAAERASASVWNALISGLAVHGGGRAALHLFERMRTERAAEPDRVTFLALLAGCSHAGLVEEGLHLLFAMKLEHGLEPGIQHYGAAVDLLARAGRLEEARRAAETLPVPPDAAVWRALLSACRNQARPDLAPAPGPARCSGDYLLLSGLHSQAGRWGCAAAAWQAMRAAGVRKKEPGLSWVELGGGPERFRAGLGWARRRSRPEARAVQRVLEALTTAAREMGFSAAPPAAAAELLEEEKEGNLMYHSERVAVAFAVLKTAPATEIRVRKNLRTCADCHSWLKAASKHLARAIIVRDRSRFHRFERGSCSCRDFW